MLDVHVNGMCSAILVAIAGKIGINAPEDAQGPLYAMLKSVDDVKELRPAILAAIREYWSDRAAVVIELAEVADVCRPGTDGVVLRTVMEDVTTTVEDLVAEDDIIAASARRLGAAGPEPHGEVRRADLGRSRMTEHGSVRGATFDDAEGDDEE